MCCPRIPRPATYSRLIRRLRLRNGFSGEDAGSGAGYGRAALGIRAGGSLDSAVAAEKLQREGYTDISLFAGGLGAWRKAGLPLEGEGVDFPVRDESPLPMFKRVHADPRKKLYQWACHNTVHSHDGTLSVSGGELRFPTARKGGTGS